MTGVAVADRHTQCHAEWQMAFRNGTRLKVDKSGRIVVPKHLRDHLGIHAEAELEVTPQSGGIFVRVVDEEPAMVKVDGLWVHRGTARADADWEHVIEDVRSERIASVSKR
jgi:AbrB family looped-hinge helix DNA binding protein